MNEIFRFIGLEEGFFYNNVLFYFFEMVCYRQNVVQKLYNKIY